MNLTKDRKVIGVESSFLIDIERGDEAAVQILNRFNTSSFQTVDPCSFEILCNSKNKEQALDMINTLNSLPTNIQAMFFAAQIYEELRGKGKQIGKVDCLIAGTFMSHNITTIITRDKHFLQIPGLSIISY